MFRDPCVSLTFPRLSKIFPWPTSNYQTSPVSRSPCRRQLNASRCLSCVKWTVAAQWHRCKTAAVLWAVNGRRLQQRPRTSAAEISVTQTQHVRSVSNDDYQVLRPTQHKIGHFGDVPSWLVMAKLNPTQQKHTFTNQKKCTTTQNKRKKLKPGLAAFYDK